MTWVLCTGMIRSGSTLQFQLTSSIVEHVGQGHRLKYIPESEFETLLNQHANETSLRVFKAHVCTLTLAKIAQTGGSKVIYCYRDIRDVAVSAMRKFDMSFDALVDAGWLDQAITDYRTWTNMPNVLVSRYEEMVCDLRKEASRIADFLGLKVDPNELTALAEQYDIPAQQQRILALKMRCSQEIKDSDIVFDEVELLHHNHIHKGEINGWRHLLSPAQQTLLTDRYRQWLTSLEYDF